MGIQIIAKRHGKIIGEFENVNELRQFQIEHKLNVSNYKELDGYDFVWHFEGGKNMKIELLKGSPIDDDNYLIWVLRQKNVMFPGMRGTRSLRKDTQDWERNEVIRMMNVNNRICLYIDDDKVSLDYFVDYCYKVGNPTNAKVGLGNLRCGIKENGTPEMAVYAAICNLQHKQEVLDNPWDWEEHEIETCY